MTLAPDIAEALRALLAKTEDTRTLTLDELGDALPMSASSDDVERVLIALESAGRRITGPPEGAARDALRAVIPAARELTRELGRRPTVSELAARTGLSAGAVYNALTLARVLGK